MNYSERVSRLKFFEQLLPRSDYYLNLNNFASELYYCDVSAVEVNKVQE